MKLLKIKLSMLTACLMLLSVSLPVSAQTAAQISKKSADAADIGPMEMDLTVFIRDNKGNERVRQITMSSGKFGDVSKTLILFTAPADVKGTSLLIYDHKDKDDDMWIFMPALKKVRRIIKAIGYSKTISYIDQSNYLCHKVEYYDFSGILHRVQHISDYKEQTGKTYFAHRMIMENVQNKSVSEMLVDRLQMGTDLSENAFSPTALQ